MTSVSSVLSSFLSCPAPAQGRIQPHLSLEPVLVMAAGILEAQCCPPLGFGMGLAAGTLRVCSNPSSWLLPQDADAHQPPCSQWAFCSEPISNGMRHSAASFQSLDHPALPAFPHRFLRSEQFPEEHLINTPGALEFSGQEAPQASSRGFIEDGRVSTFSDQLSWSHVVFVGTSSRTLALERNMWPPSVSGALGCLGTVSSTVFIGSEKQSW